MQAIRNGYDNFCKQIEKNTRITEFGFYGLSASLVIYACYRKRPFTRFVKGSDIPNEFIKQKILQKGVLQKIEATKDGPLLLLRHRPPFPLPSLSNKTLPVKISGIHVDAGNGFTWLETIAAGKNKEVRFIPFTNTSDKFVDAQVFLLEDKDKAPVDLGKSLIKIGFASTSAIPPSIDLKKDSYAKRYYNDLRGREEIAKFFRRGRWSTIPDEPFQMRRKIESLIFAVKTQERKVPALVRSGLKVLKSKAKKQLQPTVT